MTSKYQIIAFAALTGFVGCGRNEQAQNETASNTTVTAREVQERYKSAAEATKTYVTENKDEFLAATDKRLKELDTKISDLAKKSESYTDDAKVEADKALTALREQRKTANEKFEEVKKSSAEAWKEVKAGFESVLADLEKAYEDIKSKFK
jgi:hypothetical protein